MICNRGDSNEDQVKVTKKDELVLEQLGRMLLKHGKDYGLQLNLLEITEDLRLVKMGVFTPENNTLGSTLKLDIELV